MGRPAAAPDRAAAAVEEPQPHAVARRRVAQALLGAVDLPLARRRCRPPCSSPSSRASPPARRRAARRCGGSPGRRAAPRAPSPARSQLLDRLEQRHEADARHARLEVDEPGLARKQHRGEDVVRPPAHRDDVGLDHLAAVALARGARPPRTSRRCARRPHRAAAGSAPAAGASRARATAARGARRARAQRRAARPHRAGRRAGRRAWWWASACSRTSSVASWRPNAAIVRVARSTRPRAISSPRCSSSDSRTMLELGEQLPRARRSRARARAGGRSRAAGGCSAASGACR